MGYVHGVTKGVCRMKAVEITREPVELYKILKFEGLANSGAEAKLAIEEGRVRVNKQVENRKRRKIVAGDIIEYEQEILQVRRGEGGNPD